MEAKLEDKTMTKTFTFAILHFTVAFTVTYLLTGSVLVGGAVALVEPTINTVVFYFHDKVWKRYESKKQHQADVISTTTQLVQPPLPMPMPIGN